MPRIKKTSSQPKRKPKKLPKIPEKNYPDFLKEFIEEIQSCTPYIVKADQYSTDSDWNVGVLKKNGKKYLCIWISPHAKTKEDLNKFWSLTFD